MTLEDGLLGPGAHQGCAVLIRDTYRVPGLVLGDPRLAHGGKMDTKTGFKKVISTLQSISIS